jgi:hypothetical protein
MTSESTKTALNEKLPILFAYVGWAERYDGTEPINGNFSWIKDNPTENWEAKAFSRAPDGYLYCGIGRGIPARTRLHVAFVARDPKDHNLKIVGIYAAAQIVPTQDTWARVRTRNIVFFPVGQRPLVPMWPGSQGVRRWAWRAGAVGTEHRSLRRPFERIAGNIVKGHRITQPSSSGDPIDVEAQAFEGEERKLFIKHRKREARLRIAKIRQVLQLNKGRLICEVPRCNFDFEKRYGKLGAGYAQVHHKKPLGAAPKNGQKVLLKDLAVVCANCHVMIHKDGACRPIEKLIP